MSHSRDFHIAISHLQNNCPDKLLFIPECLNLRDTSNCVFVDFESIQIYVVKDGCGNVPNVPLISLACYTGALNVVKYYLEHLYSFEDDLKNPLVDKENWTPLDYARVGKQPEIIKYLLLNPNISFESSFKKSSSMKLMQCYEFDELSEAQYKELIRMKNDHKGPFKTTLWNYCD